MGGGVGHPGFVSAPAPARASYWPNPLTKSSGKCSLRVKGREWSGGLGGGALACFSASLS